jgi:hypothetical protein
MKTIPQTATLLSLGMLAFLSGCSTLYEGKYDFADGWRKGQVVQVTLASAVARPNYWQCLRATQSVTRDQVSYAVVKYSRLGKAREHLVAVPPGLDLEEKEPVFVNLGRCENAIAKQGAGSRSGT